MDVMEAIRERRSIRRYRTDPITNEVLATLLEAARLAPSWANTQCWRLVVVRDQAIKNRLAEVLSSAHSGRGNRCNQAVREAPVVIVTCAQKGLSGIYRSGEHQGKPATDKGEYWYMFDVALAMHGLTLAAQSQGLGTVHVGHFDPALVAKVLNVPDDVAVVEIMPVGYPAEAPQARPRKPLEEIVFYDGYRTPQAQP